MAVPLKVKVWIGCLAIFFFGIVSGAIGTGLYVRSRLFQAVSGGAVQGRENLARLFASHLGLTSEQRSRLEQSFATAHRRIYELRAPQRQEHLTILEQLRSEISQGLTSEQQGKVDKIYEIAKRRILLDPFANAELVEP